MIRNDSGSNAHEGYAHLKDTGTSAIKHLQVAPLFPGQAAIAVTKIDL